MPLDSRRFLPQVPIPEIYGWPKEGIYTFLFMELMPGFTFEKWRESLSQIEKVGICRQLKAIITEFYSLCQEPSEQFIGKYYNLSIDLSISQLIR